MGAAVALLIGDIVTTARLTSPEAIAATLGIERITFAELDRRANRVANALAGLGVRHGDRLAWCAAPTLRVLEAFVGAARLGAVFAPINPALPEPELAAALDYLEPRLLVTDRPGHPVQLSTVDDLAARASLRPPAQRVRESDPHIVYLTSGSTGRPKGVLVSHRASWLRAAPGGGTFATGLRGQGVACTFPLYHYGGWHYVMEAWQHRTAVHLVHRADAFCLVDLVQRWRPCALYCIPAVWERLLDAEHRRADLSSLRHADTGTSAVSTDLVARIKARLPGTTTTILYGSTEAGRMAALPDWDLDRKPGSVGLPAFPGALWVDETGEVCVRSEALMSGYLGAEPHTGPYRSGDLGHLDGEGYLYLTGRKREVIRTGGETVAPSEVEDALRDLPGVRDVAVVGLPDERWGEVVCAVFVASPAPDLELVRAHVAERLAPYKQPRRIAVVPAIPRTPATGQIQRGRLRDELGTR
jgi:fatty-acyl-CoA synthase